MQQGRTGRQRLREGRAAPRGRGHAYPTLDRWRLFISGWLGERHLIQKEIKVHRKDGVEAVCGERGCKA